MSAVQFDHLVYASRDLPSAVADIARRFGVTPAAGGRHVGVGTHNYLLDLGGGSYLELIGPDPTQEVPAGQALPFGIDTLASPALVAFAVKAPAIDDVVAAAR